MVMHGFNRGKKLLGFPTANLNCEPLNVGKELLSGVYCGFCMIEDNPIIYNCVLNIGCNPTFGVNKTNILECHLTDYSLEDFYDKQLSIVILHFIRAEKKFSGPEELKEQINLDVDKSKQFLLREELGQYSNKECFNKNFS